MDEMSLGSKLPISLDFEQLIQDGCLMTGGHFIIGEDKQPCLNTGTINSFRQAVIQYQHSKSEGVDVHLGLLINDIGQSCESTGQCSIIRSDFSKEDFKLPPVYQAILEEYCIETSELNLFWEKHIRNRGAKLFRKWKKQAHLIEKDELGYWLVDPEMFGRILLCRNSGTPTCPMIVAALIDEHKRHNFTATLNFYYIGLDNTSNVPNHFVVEKGKRAIELLEGPVSVQNIYFSEQSVLGNFDA